MTKNNQNINENTLYAWATGRISAIAIGLAVAHFIYKSGMTKKVFTYFSKKEKGKEVDQNQANTSQTTHQ